MPTNLKTCKPNCGCECDYDVKACREYDADKAHAEAHKNHVMDAYNRRTGELQRENHE